MIRGSHPSLGRLHDARPTLVLLALVLTGLGYGAPWVLSALYDEPVVPTIRGQRGVDDGVVQVWLRPEPEPAPVSEAEPEAEPEQPAAADPAPTPAPVSPSPALTPAPSVESLDLPPPLFHLGPAVLGVPRARPGVAPQGGTDGQSETASRPRKKGRKGKKRRRRPCEPDLAAIAQVTDQGYRVEDSLVAFYAGHPRETEKLATTWWNRDEAGERDGFRVGRVRCGTVLHQLGLRSGDAVMAINGKAIQSYADGLTAYLRVRQKQLIWVDVVRKGESVRIDFLLVADGTAEATREGLDPTALVEQELALAELPWLKRRRGKKAQRRRLAEAEASSQDLGLPGLKELSELGDLPADE